ncbi:hypothetical protein M5D96_008348 [Drosophila gunungcola]|uniref:Uncharacterized protein n=1 Tax=Drosophila gunungcola TaxID=103775 RepID=A0A9Q0BNV1_9MUSC|nr:hypothetical protein M5D96_008348 [Drosophila gunungcola]
MRQEHRSTKDVNVDVDVDVAIVERPGHEKRIRRIPAFDAFMQHRHPARDLPNLTLVNLRQ